MTRRIGIGCGSTALPRLGTEPLIFPSNHDGYLGGEYGQTGESDGFAAKLRDVLAGS